MMKWAVRIVYFLFLFFLIVTVGTGDSLVKADFLTKEVYGNKNDPVLAVSRNAALYNIFVDKDAVGHNTNNKPYIINMSEGNDPEHDVEVTIDLFALNAKNYGNGYFLFFSFGDKKLADHNIRSFDVTLEIQNNVTGESRRANENSFSISDSILLITLLEEDFKTYYKEENPDSEAGYSIKSILIDAHYVKPIDGNSSGVRNSVIILGDSTVPATPIENKDSDFTLSMGSTHYFVSDDFDFNNVDTARLDLENISYGKADLGAYWYMYLLVAVIYFAFLIVIPYFLFFHKKVKAKLQAKKAAKLEQAI